MLRTHRSWGLGTWGLGTWGLGEDVSAYPKVLPVSRAPRHLVSPSPRHPVISQQLDRMRNVS